MAKFKFSLETVLKVRKIREREVQKEYALALMKVEEAKRKLVELRHMEDKAQDDLASMGRNIINIKAIRYNRQYRFHLALHIIEIIGSLNEFGKEAEKVRLRLVEATKKRKVIERLRERRLEEFLKDQDRQERKVLDDMRPAPGYGSLANAE